jgi:hypothetical protein
MLPAPPPAAGRSEVNWPSGHHVSGVPRGTLSMMMASREASSAEPIGGGTNERHQLRARAFAAERF